MKKRKKIKGKNKNLKMREKELSWGDKVYEICNIMLVFLTIWYVDDKYKYEYTKNIKDKYAEATLIWLVITIITYSIYVLFKKIYKYLRSK